MQIEVRNVKVAKFASEETLCFEATVYVNGKRVATVGNDGHGGPDRWSDYAVERQIDAYAKTLPPVKFRVSDTEVMDLEQNAEMIIGDLVNEALLLNDFKRDLSKRIMWIDEEGKVRMTKAMPKAQLTGFVADPLLVHKLPKNPKAVTVLNQFALPEAFRQYKAAMEAAAPHPLGA